jgi:predicted dehydrogenase
MPSVTSWLRGFIEVMGGKGSVGRVSDPLPIGVVGAGPWARMVTGPLLAAGPQTRVTGVWSRTAAHADELAAQLSVPSFSDLDALFETCAAVAIAVAPSAQPAIAQAAAKAGKTLLLEKPLGADVAGAEQVVDAVRNAGVGALVMLSNRFNPALDDFLVAAAATEPYGGRGCFISGAFLGGPFANGWRLERGAVLDIGPHLLDLLEAALGEIVDVRASGDALGAVSVLCQHDSGASSTALMCCNAPTDSRTEVEVLGRRGTALYDGRSIDHRLFADRLRRDLVALAAGSPHPAGVERALHLQRLIADIESQLESNART